MLDERFFEVDGSHCNAATHQHAHRHFRRLTFGEEDLDNSRQHHHENALPYDARATRRNGKLWSRIRHKVECEGKEEGHGCAEYRHAEQILFQKRDENTSEEVCEEHGCRYPCYGVCVLVKRLRDPVPLENVAKDLSDDVVAVSVVVVIVVVETVVRWLVL